MRTKNQKLEELQTLNISRVNRTNRVMWDYTMDDIRFVENWLEKLSYRERRESYKLYLETHTKDNPHDFYPNRTYAEWKEMEESFVYAETEDNGGRIFLYPCEA